MFEQFFYLGDNLPRDWLELLFVNSPVTLFQPLVNFTIAKPNRNIGPHVLAKSHTFLALLVAGVEKEQLSKGNGPIPIDT